MDNPNSVFDLEINPIINRENLQLFEKELDDLTKEEQVIDFKIKGLKAAQYRALINAINKMQEVDNRKFNISAEIDTGKATDEFISAMNTMARLSPKIKIDDTQAMKAFDELYKKWEILSADFENSRNALLSQTDFSVFEMQLSNAWKDAKKVYGVLNQIYNLNKRSGGKIYDLDEYMNLPIGAGQLPSAYLKAIDDEFKEAYIKFGTDKKGTFYQEVRNTDYSKREEKKEKESTSSNKSVAGKVTLEGFEKTEQDIKKISQLLQKINHNIETTIPNAILGVDSKGKEKNTKATLDVSELKKPLDDIKTLLSGLKGKFSSNKNGKIELEEGATGSDIIKAVEPNKTNEEGGKGDVIEVTLPPDTFDKLSSDVGVIKGTVSEIKTTTNNIGNTLGTIDTTLAKGINVKGVDESKNEVQTVSAPQMDSIHEELQEINTYTDVIESEVNKISVASEASKNYLQQIASDIVKGVVFKESSSSSEKSGKRNTKEPTPILPPENINVEDMTSQTWNMRKDVLKSIQAYTTLGKNTGGLAESILSQSDVETITNRLKQVETALDSMIRGLDKENVSPKFLVQTNSNLVELENELNSDKIKNSQSIVNDYAELFLELDGKIGYATSELSKFNEQIEQRKKIGIDTSDLETATKKVAEELDLLERYRSYLSGGIFDEEKIVETSKSLTKTFAPVEAAMSNVRSMMSVDISGIFNSLKSDTKEVEGLEKKLNSLLTQINRAKKNGLDLSKIVIGDNLTLKDADNFVNNYFDNRKNQATQFASETEFQAYAQNFKNNVLEPMKEYASITDEAKREVDKLLVSAQETKNIQLGNTAASNFEKRLSTRLSELTKWGERNTQALAVPEYKGEYEKFLERLKTGTIGADEELAKFNQDWAEFVSRVTQAGKTGKTFGTVLGEMFKKFGSWTMVTRVISTTIRLLKDMVVEVKEVDSAMVNLKKVTDVSESSLDAYLNRTAKTSKALGTVMTDQIDATAQFSRLGYTLEEAEKLGEVASKYKSVAEDLDIDTASQSIVSTLQAYKNVGVTADEIVDQLNYTGNNFAISSAELGSALQRSAASLYSANNDLAESIGMITAGKIVA